MKKQEPPRVMELDEHVAQEVFRAVLMMDATRREILKHPAVMDVQIAFTPEPSNLMIRIGQRGKMPPRVFMLKVSELPDQSAQDELYNRSGRSSKREGGQS